MSPIIMVNHSDNMRQITGIICQEYMRCQFGDDKGTILGNSESVVDKDVFTVIRPSFGDRLPYDSPDGRPLFREVSARVLALIAVSYTSTTEAFPSAIAITVIGEDYLTQYTRIAGKIEKIFPDCKITVIVSPQQIYC